MFRAVSDECMLNRWVYTVVPTIPVVVLLPWVVWMGGGMYWMLIPVMWFTHIAMATIVSTAWLTLLVCVVSLTTANMILCF